MDDRLCKKQIWAEPEKLVLPICNHSKNAYFLIFDTKKAPIFRGFQTVDKALLLQGFAIVGTAFMI